MYVRTYGGAGGYGLPKIHGAGSNGGRGGDGGNIWVHVDPSVDSYDLRTSTKGGPGGRASDPDQTNDLEEGEPGAPGEDGAVTTEIANVVIAD